MTLHKTLHSEPLSRDKFVRPSRSLGILPFWFWNGDMNKEEMAWQLEQYRAQGMPGFMIHSRFGHTPEYLGDEWFDRVKFAVQKAEELGLQAWVYDEKNWPSGTVGWELPTKFPDLQQRYMEMIVADVQGPYFSYLEGTDSRYIDMEQSEPICAYAVREDEFHGVITEVVDLNPNLSWDKIVSWESPPGNWKLLFFIERRATWHSDVLNPATTKKFLEMTHEKYKAAVGEKFGEVVPGFYTDEPAIHYFAVSCNNRIVPWSKQMFKIFREHNGYDLRPFLPALFLNMGEKTAKIRYDFWNAMSEQYSKAYYKQIQDWCHENNVNFIGHMLFEDLLRLQVRAEGNLFRNFRYFDVVGVDKLYPKIGGEKNPEEHVAIKLGASAAHALGSTRVLCESFGGSYWDVTMERMKWIADWEYVLGINLLNPHGFHYSIEGDRKRDWPPSQFYHHTWWDKYQLFQDYITRNSYLLSGGRHVAKVAMLYPAASMWANYQPQGHNPVTEVMEHDFNFMTDRLLRIHFDFDYVDEDVVLPAAKAEGGQLKVRDEEFSVFLMPPVTHLKAGTLALLEQLVAQGGHIIADSLLPVGALGGEDPGFAARVEQLFGLNPAEVNARFTGASTKLSRHVKEHAGGGKAIFLGGRGLFRAEDGVAALDSALRQCITPDIEIADDRIFSMHRRKDDSEIYFIVNPTDVERTFAVSVEAAGVPERWDNTAGTQAPLAVFDIKNGRTEFSLTLAPFQSTFIVIDPTVAVPQKRVTAAPGLVVERIAGDVAVGYGRITEDTWVETSAGNRVAVTARTPAEPITVTGPWQFAVKEDNVLFADTFQVAIEETAAQGVAAGWAQPGFDDTAWMTFKKGGWELQLPFERDERTYPVTLWYRTRFTTPYVPADLRLLVDGLKGKWELFLNGEPLTGPFERSRIDAMIKEVNIAGRVNAGENLLAIRLTVPDRTSGVLDLVKVVGSFSLQHGVTAPPLTEMEGMYSENGYPFFSGTGSYTQSIEVPASFAGKRLFLEVEAGDDLVEAEVNGRSAGVLLWHPYTLEVTELVKPGANTLTIKVTNTLMNMLEAEKKPSGIRGKVRLVPFDVYEVKF